MIGPDLGGHARRLERGLLGLGDDLQVGLAPARTDVVHQLGELVAREPDVLAADVAEAGVRDRGVDVSGVGERDVVAREHEDELDHSRPPLSLSCLTTGTLPAVRIPEEGRMRAAIWNGPGSMEIGTAPD